MYISVCTNVYNKYVQNVYFMYVHVCTYVCVCMYVCITIYVCMYVCMHVCVYVCVYVGIYMSKCEERHRQRDG